MSGRPELSITEAAHAAGKSRKTIGRMLDAGELSLRVSVIAWHASSTGQDDRA